MKKALKLMFMAVTVFALHLTPYTLHVCYASFDDIGSGARPMGMGSAFCGIADDVNAFFYNPSGLTQLEMLQVSAMYANLYPGLSDGSGIANNYIAVAYPSSIGTIGFSWFNLSVNSDPQRAKMTYSENTYIVSYARYVKPLSLGVSLKLRSKEYGESYWTSLNPTFQQTRTASGVSFDVSALYKTRNERLTAGVMLSDVNQPDIHLVTTSVVPFALRAGVGYRLDPAWSFDDIVAAFDMTARDGYLKFHSGIEGWLEDKSIGLRAGIEFGTSSFGSLSFGASYRLKEELYGNDFRVDYAFLYPLSGMQPTGGTHRVSLTMGFGGF